MNFNNPFAPPFNFIEKTFLPLVCQMGPEILIRLITPGFYPAGGGQMKVTINLQKH